MQWLTLLFGMLSKKVLKTIPNHQAGYLHFDPRPPHIAQATEELAKGW